MGLIIAICVLTNKNIVIIIPTVNMAIETKIYLKKEEK